MTVIPRGDVKTFIFFGLYSVASLFLFAGFVHLLAGYTKGKQHYMGFVRISALASILDWLATVPFLALLIVFWGIAVAVVATEEIYELTRGKAVLTVLAAVSTLWVVTLLLFTGPFAPFYESLGAP